MPDYTCRLCGNKEASRNGGICTDCETKLIVQTTRKYSPGNHRTVWCTGCGLVKIHHKTEYCFNCNTRIAAEREAAAAKPLPTEEELAKMKEDLFG